MPAILILACLTGFYLVFNFSILPFFSTTDGHIYIYMSTLIEDGSVLYRDIFHTNMPLVPYIALIYRYLTFGNLHLFYAMSHIETAITAWAVFFVIKKLLPDDKHNIAASLGAVVFLYSLSVFSTSSHWSGVTLPVMMTVLSYLAYLSKRLSLSGALMALAVLAKAYTAPLALALTLDALIRYRLASWRLVISAAATTLIVMLPTIVYALPQFFEQTFGYSLSRGASNDRMAMWRFMMVHDWLGFFMAATSIIWIRRSIYIALGGLLTLLFLISYQDIFVLYFTTLMPIAGVCAAFAYDRLRGYFPERVITTAFVVLVSVSCFLNITHYAPYSHTAGRYDKEQLLQVIEEQNPDYLYGEGNLIHGLSYLTGVPVINDMADTYFNLFREGVYSRKEVTDDILSKRTLVLSYGVDRPGLRVPIQDEIFEGVRIYESCTLVESFPVKTGKTENLINFYRCYE